MSEARREFQARMAYSDEAMLEMDKKVAIDDCWGAPMSYERLVALFDEHEKNHILSMIYHADKVYYGDWDWTTPHPLAQGVKAYGKWGEFKIYEIEMASGHPVPFPQCKTFERENRFGNKETVYTLELYDAQLKPFFDLCRRLPDSRWRDTKVGGVLYTQYKDETPVLTIVDDYVD